MGVWEFLDRDLERLRSDNLYREPDDFDQRSECEIRAAELGVNMLDASSNDYLGYGSRAVSRETTASTFVPPHAARETLHPEAHVGAGASRLVHGTRPIHRALEGELADWTRQPTALLFTSGYAANIGVLSALPRAGDLILSDALNHASIVDGCRLSRADVAVFAHLDAAAVENLLIRECPNRRVWLVTESYFSMDGDTPNLELLRHICDKHDAYLILDEAHALGVFGPHGSGLAHEHGVTPDILIGTFGKALGAQGAFASSSASVRNWLWNRARSFVYSTAPSPLLCERILCNVRLARCDEANRTRLTRTVRYLRGRLNDAGLRVPDGSHGPIVSVILGAPERALAAAKLLRERAILVQAIRPPTVAHGSARIRVTVNANLSQQDVERLADAIVDTCGPS